MKLAHNVFLGVVTQSLAEVTVLAESGGMPRAAFLDFLNDTCSGRRSPATRRRRLSISTLTPTFTPVLLRKDFDLGLEAARRLEVPMPVAALTYQLVQAVIGRGHARRGLRRAAPEQAAAAGMTLVPENVPVDDGLSLAEEPR